MKTAAVVLAALMLTACGSTGGSLGDLSDIILGSPSSTQPSDVQGYVQSVDTRAQRIDLTVSTINNLRDSGGQSGSIYYDSRTRVLYNNREYNVTDLERGDEIAVRGYNDNGRYMAETITVLRDATR